MKNAPAQTTNEGAQEQRDSTEFLEAIKASCFAGKTRHDTIRAALAHVPARDRKYKARQATSQPSNGAVGDAFYRALFGGKDGVK